MICFTYFTEFQYCRGSLKYLIKIYRGAIEDLTTAIQLDRPHSFLAHYNRALCYHAINEPWKVSQLNF